MRNHGVSQGTPSTTGKRTGTWQNIQVNVSSQDPKFTDEGCESTDFPTG